MASMEKSPKKQINEPVLDATSLDSPSRGDPDSVLLAAADQIHDCIEDAKILRAWRPKVAKGLILLALAFYVMLIALVLAFAYCPRFATLLQAPTICLTLLVIFAAIPTLILVGVMRAIFGSKNQSSPYTPLHALLQVMKDIKDSGA